jgi:hypothetical protein
VRRCTVLIVASALASGCGSDPSPPPSAPQREKASPQQAEREPRRATCPAGAANCEAATGRVIFLESVDPDGDGDLHLVIAGGGVTGPGFSVLDIGRHLRPKRDPRIGDTASAAGPVYRGSYGQRQIEATELFITRR